MPKQMQGDLSVSQAAEKIYGEANPRTRLLVQRNIGRGAFPGARKLDPTRRTSPYLIPSSSVYVFIAKQKKRGQAEEV